MGEAGKQEDGRRWADAAEGRRPWDGRAILLVDLDAFFASVEQLDHPGWRGKPVVVGGSADARGVVSTASYEARAFGVHSAMPSSVARQLCPQAIWTPGHYNRYREVSNAIMAILAAETPFMQQVSIDEAFLDVTPTRSYHEHPAAIAARIQQRVKSEVGVTCSVGVGTTKTVAKIASDYRKPRGLTVVYPGEEQAFLAPLPVKAMSGIGKASQAKLQKFGVQTLGQLAQADAHLLRSIFGKNGELMRTRALGGEESPVRADTDVKSVSNETSFAHDLTAEEDVHAALATMAGKVGRRLRAKGLAGHTLTVKVRKGDRSIHSAQTTLGFALDDEIEMMPYLRDLLSQVWHAGQQLRLIGVGVSGFAAEDAPLRAEQLSLFGAEGDGGEAQAGAQPAHGGEAPDPLASREKRQSLLASTDAVRKRFGDAALHFGHELRNAENTTGTTPKDMRDYR